MRAQHRGGQLRVAAENIGQLPHLERDNMVWILLLVGAILRHDRAGGGLVVQPLRLRRCWGIPLGLPHRIFHVCGLLFFTCGRFLLLVLLPGLQLISGQIPSCGDERLDAAGDGSPGLLDGFTPRAAEAHSSCRGEICPSIIREKSVIMAAGSKIMF